MGCLWQKKKNQFVETTTLNTRFINDADYNPGEIFGIQ